jgi:TPR repeat protein
MERLRLFFALALVFVACGAMPADGAPTMAQAHRALYLGRYQEALALYESLADAGNPEAAERAGFMLLMAEMLYGDQVKRDAARAGRLLVKAAYAGRAGAAFLLTMIEGSD